MTSASASPPPRPDERAHAGRPMDASRDEALRTAALELVAEIGYDRLTIDAVAARARAGKATVYRRWASKAELVADAFVCDAFKGLDAPDTGSLRSDLLAISEQIWVRSGPVPRATVMAGMMSALLASPELRDAFQAVARPPESVVLVVIRRAVDRQEIPEPDDLELVGAVMPSMSMFHLVKTGTAPTSPFFQAVIDRIILPALQFRPAPRPEGNRHAGKR